MTERAPPAWLEAFQASFGAMLRTPLARQTGQLQATPANYDAALKAAAVMGQAASGEERLAVYNRQYWFRLFTVFHGAFPLTTRLLSHFTFNDYASRFLLAHPPRVWDIHDVVVGFAEFLEQATSSASVSIDGQRAGVERTALLQAARIDAAFQSVLRAPYVEPFRPTAQHAERLLSSQLELSPAVALFDEDWPLCELRRKLALDPGEQAVPLPARLTESQFWLLRSESRKTRQLALEPLEARLLRLLVQLPVGLALARLEQDCPAERVLQLPSDAQRWLARSVENGCWRGLAAVAAPGV